MNIQFKISKSTKLLMLRKPIANLITYTYSKDYKITTNTENFKQFYVTGEAKKIISFSLKLLSMRIGLHFTSI